MKLFSTSITINRDIQTVFNYFRTMSNVEEFLPKNTTLENLNYEEDEQVELGKAYFAKWKEGDEEFTLQLTLVDISEFEYQTYKYKIIDWKEEEDEVFNDFMNYFNMSYHVSFKTVRPNKIKVKQEISMHDAPLWIKVLMVFQMIPEYFETRRDNKKIKAALENR